MELTRANLDSIFLGFQTVLQTGLSKADANWQRFAGVISSGNAIEEYPFMSMPSGMEKWIGDRQINKLDGKMIRVANDDYSNAIEVKRNDVRRDRIGVYNAFFTDMGINAANLWGKLAILALVSNPTWADDKAFFVADRKFSKKSVINNVTNAVFSITAFKAARAAMMSYCDAAGDPLEIVPDTLMVGPSNEELALKLKNNDLIKPDGGGEPESNPYKGTFELIVSPRLVGDHAGKWFLQCTSRGVKPVIVQKELEGALTRQDREEDDCVFERNVNRYGIHYSGAAIPTYPQLTYGGGF